MAWKGARDGLGGWRKVWLSVKVDEASTPPTECLGRDQAEREDKRYRKGSQ